MAGRWTEIYDDERKRWIKVYIDLPSPLSRGSASAAYGTADDPILYGPDGLRLKAPKPDRQIGFGRR